MSAKKKSSSKKDVSRENDLSEKTSSIMKKSASKLATNKPCEEAEDDDDLPTVNYNPEQSGGMTIQQFAANLTKGGKPGLEQEYREICQETKPAKPAWEEFLKNKEKNRYWDVYCYDKRRVIIKPKKPTKPDIYIHANFVDGYKQRKAYICTQGPTPETFVDFWRMIWQQGCVLIVSLTKMVEAGKEKCAQYWPERESKVVKYGKISVTTVHIQTSIDMSYAKSLLRLEHDKTKEIRSVFHLLYLKWPDFGTPSKTETFLRFREVMNEGQRKMLILSSHWSNKTRPPPIVIHCSAGVGRTGTLVAVDICLKQLADKGIIAVRDTVIKIRRQRYMAVQKPDQFAFINLSLLEYAINQSIVDVSKLDLSGVVQEVAAKEGEAGSASATLQQRNVDKSRLSPAAGLDKTVMMPTPSAAIKNKTIRQSYNQEKVKVFPAASGSPSNTKHPPTPVEKRTEGGYEIKAKLALTRMSTQCNKAT